MAKFIILFAFQLALALDMLTIGIVKIIRSLRSNLTISRETEQKMKAFLDERRKP